MLSEGSFFQLLKDLHQVIAFPEIPDAAVEAELIITEQMTDQVSLTVEPDLYPGIIMVGIIMMKRTGMQNVGIPCREPG